MDLSWEMITCLCVCVGGGAFGCVHSKNGSVLFHTESMLSVKTHGVDMPRGTYFQYEIYTSIFAVWPWGPRSLMIFYLCPVGIVAIYIINLNYVHFEVVLIVLSTNQT